MAFASKKFDEVSKNRILEEAIRREEKTVRLNTTFTITDPRKMTILADKPNSIRPVQPSEQEVAAAEASLNTLSCTKHITQSPTDIYALPLTSNMEYGFFNGAVMAQRDAMFTHYKGHCDVTKYASSYASMTGRSPYMKPAAAGGAAGAGAAAAAASK